MNQATRIEKIKEILKQEPYGKQEIPWKDKLELMPVYKVKLDYLVYNKYNGRILSRTKSLETQNRKIDAELDIGRKLIEKLLWDSKPQANKKTLESIEKYGQEKVGIVTRDGIIIDGNRRAMLLKKTPNEYFKSVILPVALEEDPLEIEKLETSFQMAEDEKLGYNAIEKYLKADGLRKRNVEPAKIAEWMGESEAAIDEYLEVMETMDSYLDYLGYNGIYTQLDGREDQFINLTKWLKKFRNEEGSLDGFDGYKQKDVDDLEMISFDYIRCKFEGKKFRNIAYGRRESHFFGDEKIWKSFRDYHFNHIEPIKDEEEKLDYDSENLEAYLNDRDMKFFERTKNEHGESFLDENVDSHFQQLGYNKASNEPAKLTSAAKRALEAIDQKHIAFSSPEVLNEVKAINHMTTDMLKVKSPQSLLAQVIDLLESMDIKDDIENKEYILKEIAKINKISFEIKKRLGG